VLIVALLVPVVTVLSLQARWLAAARDDSLTPFLALSQAKAISYDDAAADTSRYLISDKLAYYQQDFTAKSGCLLKGGSCGTRGESITGGLAGVAGGSDVSPDATGQVVSRCTTYEHDHSSIAALAGRPGRQGDRPAHRHSARGGGLRFLVLRRRCRADRGQSQGRVRQRAGRHQEPAHRLGDHPAGGARPGDPARAAGGPPALRRVPLKGMA
jgi:hypothetical protein